MDTTSAAGAPSSSTARDDKAPRSRIARYDQYYDLRTLNTAFRKTNKPSKAAVKLSKKTSVLIVIRVMNNKGHHTETLVEIRSQQLFQLLLDLNEKSEWMVENKSPPRVNPRLFFFSHQALCERLAKEQEKEPADQDMTLISEIEVALQFIVEDFSHVIAEIQCFSQQCQISFDLLWAFIPPKALVYTRDHYTEQDMIMRTNAVNFGVHQDGGRYARISCDFVHDDGDSFGLATRHIDIQEFAGQRNVRDLDLYPLPFHPHCDKLYAKAVERARKFVPITRHLYETRGSGVRSADDGKVAKFWTYGRVMIDPSAFRIYDSDFCVYNQDVHTRLERDTLSEEDLAIFSPIMRGFCFGNKTWGGFAIDRLTEVEWSEEAFQLLVLGAKQKDLVHALIRQHTVRSSMFDDIIRGKGKGLVGLLCGPPGCGKTLTAEAAAELTHSPLYTVSAGELGTNAEDVDRRLARVLELAQLWSAVLLLDEADVFLQARSSTDLVRNAVVSIFLRQLEYYQGILILTTNLVAQFDPAFESRIHFCIYYPQLDSASRYEIWRTFLRKALGEEGIKAVTDVELKKLASREMNGRQIKNAVSSAHSVALDAQETLSITHIDKVLDVIGDWRTAQMHAQAAKRDLLVGQHNGELLLDGF